MAVFARNSKFRDDSEKYPTGSQSLQSPKELDSSARPPPKGGVKLCGGPVRKHPGIRHVSLYYIMFIFDNVACSCKYVST
jgi:hypothetical protein